MALLEVTDLRVHFRTPEGTVRAVDGVDLSLERGRTLALVGESGSGKSVTGLALMGLLPAPPAVTLQGSVRLEGQELLRLPEPERRKLRGSRVAMIFQDPMTALNPLLTVGRQLTEVLEVHRGMGGAQARVEARRALEEVRLPDAERRLDQHPHQLSGGMRQRVVIAMALLLRPALLVADEPTTALDVTIQAQILELIAQCRERSGTAVLLITHDLGVVAGSADDVAVMYAGRVVEQAPVTTLFAAPRHPYTRGLLDSLPRLGGARKAPLVPIAGQPPAPTALPSGCPFHPRCPRAVAQCLSERPPLLELAPGHRTACWEAAREAGGAAADAVGTPT